MKMKIIFRKFLLLIWTSVSHCSISGISYMDPIKISSIKNKLPPGEDPCNPLYWYPRQVPEYCNDANTVRPPISEKPPTAQTIPPPAPPILVPMLPPPVPILPPPVPILPPPMPILPPPMPILPPPMPILPPPMPILPPPPLMSGPLSLFPAPPQAPLISISSNPYPYSNLNPMSGFSSNSLSYYPSFQRPLTGLVPGIHDLVTKDGGINIMPFSDAYADMLEKHKNKMIRRRLHKILDKYENDPYSSDYRSLRKYEKYFTDD